MSKGTLLKSFTPILSKQALIMTIILNFTCLVLSNSLEAQTKNTDENQKAALESKNTFLSFLSDADNKENFHNNDLLILDMKIENHGILIDLFNSEKPEAKRNSLLIDLLNSDSFIFNFTENENASNHLDSKILFHSDFLNADNNKNLNYSNFKIKDSNKNEYWNITDFLFKHMKITHSQNASNVISDLWKHSTFINKINPKGDAVGTLSLSRESDDFEFFQKIKNENFESEDFLFDIENKKLIFGYTNEYKKLNLTELYNKDFTKGENNNPLNSRDFTYCYYYDTDYLVINKKRKFHNCFLSYVYLGENFDLNLINGKQELTEDKDLSQSSSESNEASGALAPLEIKKMAIFDSLTKLILIPIENQTGNNKEADLNYRSFYKNLIKENYKKDLADIEAIKDFYCFITDNSFENSKDLDSNVLNNNNDGVKDDLLFLHKKSLVCLSEHPKEYLIRNSNSFFNKQNLILNTISYELSLENLLDELNSDLIPHLIANTKQESLFFSAISANNNFTNNDNTNDQSSRDKSNSTTENPNEEVSKKNILELVKRMQFAFEYNINFYNATRIHKLLEENKKSLLLKDNIFQYDSSPVILGTSFLMGFDQISFEETNKKIEFYGGKFKDLTSILHDPSAIGMFSNFIFSTLWVLILIMIFILVPYYFYRRRKRLLMEKLQYEIIYRKMDDITKEWAK